MIIKYFLSITFDTHFIEDIVHVSHYLRGPLGSLQDPFSSLLYFSLYYQIFYVFKIFFLFIYFLSFSLERILHKGRDIPRVCHHRCKKTIDRLNKVKCLIF